MAIYTKDILPKNNSFCKCKGIIGNGGENGKCNNA